SLSTCRAADYAATVPDTTHWLSEHATRLDTIDPDADLDELEPLGELVGNARVVAVGEGAHFVEEFAQARARMLRYLDERCGYSVLLAEYGFASGFATDQWVRGDDYADDVADLGGTLTSGVNGALLRWLRAYNATARRAVGFGGVDIPVSASLLPVLDPLH